MSATGGWPVEKAATGRAVLGHDGGVAEVDAGNDSRRRYVVYRYAYDLERHERRRQVVAAFRGRRQWERYLNARAKELQMRRDAGEDVDPREYYGGSVLEPGHVRRQRNARFLRRAVDHGVWPVDASALDLPASVSFFTSD